jgi:predicted transcriptional regulator
MRPHSFIHKIEGVRSLLDFCNEWRAPHDVAKYFDVSLVTATKWLNRLYEQHYIDKRIKPYQYVGRPGYEYRAFLDEAEAEAEAAATAAADAPPPVDDAPSLADADLSFLD